MEAGICYIKKEFLLPEEEKREEEHDKTDKKDRKRGQNRKRPIYKDDRTLHLCNSLVQGANNETCKITNCRYVHDLEKYLAAKGEDLGTECHVFTLKGYCPRGVTCRFAKAHMDAEGRNIKAADYDEARAAEAQTTFNGITTELQVRLRKHEFDFTHSKNLLSKYNKQREEEKAKQNLEKVANDEMSENKISNDEVSDNVVNNKMSIDEKPNDKVLTDELEINVIKTVPEKSIGAAVDDDETNGRDVRQKSPVDFAGKLILSPLTTVGNLPFRRICKEFGADITCGEMACAVPLVKGLTQEWALTKRHESEDVFGVQLCGNNASILSQTAQLLQETTKVDYLDLNIGCPIDLIYKQGGGSAFMRRPNVLEAVVRTCSALSPQIPFTVKMRTGVYADEKVAHKLMPLVEEWGAAAVTLHGRSREQRYTKHADWEYIEQCAAKIKHIPVIGNGDILNFEDYNERKQMAPHVSSVMIGRGALIKPWIFKEIKEQKQWNPTSSERFDIMRKYVNYGMEHWGSDTKGVENTRRFLLEWQSFLYRYIPYELLENPPQKINQRPQKYRGRDEMETLMSSANSADWVKLTEMLLGTVPDGFSFMPKHKANSF